MEPWSWSLASNMALTEGQGEKQIAGHLVHLPMWPFMHEPSLAFIERCVSHLGGESLQLPTDPTGRRNPSSTGTWHPTPQQPRKKDMAGTLEWHR